MNDFMISVLEWIDQFGIWGPVLFILLYALAAVLLIPGSALTLGAGALFGVAQGSILVSIASTLGASLSFLIGRYAARDKVAEKVAQRPNFKAVDEAVGREGWKIVALTRLSPVFPFTFLNYAYGLTKVKFPHCLLASWIGMMPGTVMYVYLGSLARLGVQAEEATGAQITMRIIGLLATVGVTVYITKIARKALKEKVDE
jgi:uncharacterized membrane protein YdjX (TVP38/TMEM64 family)